MQVTVQATVRHPDGPPGTQAVTVDASALGGSRTAPMHDDGRHGDEKPGDGIYGAPLAFSATVFGKQGFRETSLLTVSAVDRQGRRASWPAVVHLSRGPIGIDFMRGGWESPRSDGPVTIRMVREKGLRPDAHVLSIAATGPGPWRAGWLMPGDGENSAGLKWLTFRIKGDVDQELTVQLMDFHKIGSEGFFDEPHLSAPARLREGGYLAAITQDYQEVRIPIARLLPKGVYFLRWHTAGISVSVPAGGAPGTYHIDQPRLEP
jgi:hypothetical protein